MTDDAKDALPEPGATETTPETAPSAPETGPETPTVEAPAAGTTEIPPTTAPETPTVEAPAAGTTEVPPTTAPVTAVPVAAAPVAAEPAKRSGITVPTWLAALIGAAIVFALGFGIGYGVGDDHDGGNRSVQAGPGFGFNGRLPEGGQLPFGGQFGNGNGGNGRLPDGNDNGNGNDDNGGSNGGSTGAGVFLGVAAQDSTSPEGAELVRVVAGSPAAEAGLKAGDVITEVDDESIGDSSELTAAVRSQEAGDTVTITYLRDGESETTKATLSGSSDFSSQ